MSNVNYSDFSILYLSKKIKIGQISPLDLTKFCIYQIEKYNSILNSFITVLKHEALEEAYSIEKEIKKGKYLGPLQGIPFSIKDNISAKDIRSTKGSQIFSKSISSHDSTVIKKLKKTGAILLGTNNLNEFASGIDGKNIFYGNTKNPWDTKRISGGSSGGSSVAVATGMVFFSIGTDTGGSVRVPASLCGIIGFKPTYDLINRSGIFDLSPSLDHVGILTRNISDCILVFNTLFEKKCLKYIKKSTSSFSQNVNTILGIPQVYFLDYLEPEVRELFNRFIKKLSHLNLNVKIVNFTLTNELIYKSWLAVRIYESWKIHNHLMDKYHKLYSPEVRNMLLEGKNITSEKYEKALNKIDKIKQYFYDIFNNVDFFLTPTTIITAPKSNTSIIKVQDKNIKVREALLRNTIVFNSIGFPALTIPIGANRFTKMPIGLQIIAKPYYDREILAFSNYLKKNLDFNNNEITDIDLSDSKHRLISNHNKKNYQERML